MVLLGVGWFTSRKKIQQLLNDVSFHTEAIATLEKQQQHFKMAVEESQARSLVVAQNTQRAELAIDELKKQFSGIVEQDPDSKLYQLAADMLQQGASIEEIMHSCDLPRAEVQLLQNIHRK